MHRLSLKSLLCIHICFAGHIPFGEISADVVVFQTDAGLLYSNRVNISPVVLQCPATNREQREGGDNSVDVSVCIRMCVYLCECATDQNMLLGNFIFMALLQLANTAHKDSSFLDMLDVR